MMNRLFIALEIPDEALEQVIQIRDSVYGFGDRIKWEPKNKLHLTLKFLGDVDYSMNDKIIKKVSEIAGNYGKIESELDRFGMFYRKRKPAILWVGIKNNEKIKTLQKDIEEGMHELGFPKEKREFHAHITLLRVKGREDIEKLKKLEKYELEPISFMSDKISLIKSELTQKGSIYSTVQSFNLTP
jgi:2'-5' RNA ligase